jgi:hypothetical protein
MKAKKIGVFFGCGLLVLCTASGLSAQERYEVTITNLTRGQVITPPVVYSDNGTYILFQEGESVRPVVSTLAETGNPAPLVAKLKTVERVSAIAVGEGVILPGQSVILELEAGAFSPYFTALGMLAQTNDAFFGIQHARLPQAESRVDYFAPAYDAGSEGNNEMSAFVPGPPFGGTLRDTENAEGFLHIHSGIYGKGEVAPAMYDWRNPVVKITVVRMNETPR